MARLGLSTAIIIAALTATPALAQSAAAAGAGRPPGQRALSAEMKADSEALRALLKDVPPLPMDKVEVKVAPAMTLEGYSAATADKAGNIWVIHRPASKDVDPVIEMDRSGKFIRSFGKGMFTIPHGVRIDPQGNVWTIDAHTSMIYKFTPQGKKLLEISVGDIPDANRPFCGATDVSFAKDGHVFVSDGYCNGRFIEYSAEGQKLKEWGKRGKGPGEFNNAHDIAIHPDGRIFVADRENGRLQWFTHEGKYLGEKHFGGQLFSVAISDKGEVFVGTQPRDVDFGVDGYIVKFDPATGKLLGKAPAPSHQLSVGPDGSIYPGIRVDKTDAVLVYRPGKAG